MSAESSWPNLFVVGAAKSGTTSIWRYLGDHPDIFMTYFKEPHFFSQSDPSWAPFIHDEAAYLRLFAGAREPLRGEASPSYLVSERAATGIKAVSPDAKIVIALRDPVERAHSNYWHRMRVGREHRTFAAAIAEEVELGFPPDRGRYVAQMNTAQGVRRYSDLFDPNLRVVVFEELIRDFERELADLYAFLRVDPTVASRVEPERHNPFAVPRNRVAAGVLGSRRMRKLSRAIVPYRLRGPIERRLLATRPKPPIDLETDRVLTEYFEPDVRELATLLGRPLPWPRWATA